MTEKSITTGSKAAERLLFTRLQVAELLGGISVASVQRLERTGKLRPIRLSGKKSAGQVFFKAADVLAMIDSASAADASAVEVSAPTPQKVCRVRR